jgi:hypothetical protein
MGVVSVADTGEASMKSYSVKVCLFFLISTFLCAAGELDQYAQELQHGDIFFQSSPGHATADGIRAITGSCDGTESTTQQLLDCSSEWNHVAIVLETQKIMNLSADATISQTVIDAVQQKISGNRNFSNAQFLMIEAVGLTPEHAQINSMNSILATATETELLQESRNMQVNDHLQTSGVMLSRASYAMARSGSSPFSSNVTAQHSWFALARLNLSESEIETFVKAALTHFQKKYDYLFVLENTEYIYCSELVYEALKAVGLHANPSILNANGDRDYWNAHYAAYGRIPELIQYYDGLPDKLPRIGNLNLTYDVPPDGASGASPEDMFQFFNDRGEVFYYMGEPVDSTPQPAVLPEPEAIPGFEGLTF